MVETMSTWPGDVSSSTSSRAPGLGTAHAGPPRGGWPRRPRAVPGRPVPRRPNGPRSLNLSAQILCITDYTYVLLWCNVAFERTLGYGAAEM